MLVMEVVRAVVGRMRHRTAPQRRRRWWCDRIQRRRGGGRARSPVHLLVRAVFVLLGTGCRRRRRRRRVPTTTRRTLAPPTVPPSETRQAQQDRDEDVESVLDRAVQGEEAQGGEVGQGPDEVTLPPAREARPRRAGRVERRRRDIGRVAKVGIRSVVR